MRYWISVMLLVFAGCGGDAVVELRAGDALDKAADIFQATVEEYHDEVVVADDGREEAVAMAFVDRMKASTDNPQDVADFLAAQRKIRADREVESMRFSAASDNVKGLRDVASGLREIATASMTLDDEMRRYFSGWIEQAKTARSERQAERLAERQRNRETVAGYVRQVFPRATPAAPAPAAGGGQ